MLKTKELYQWDTNKRLEVDNRIITEVQFANILSEEALVVAVYEENGKRYANIPDELLTEPYTLHAYASCGNCVEEEAEFKVIKRAKPDDYIYSALPIDGGLFTYYDTGSTTLDIKHNLGKYPKYIVLYPKYKGNIPSSNTAFTSYGEILHSIATKNVDNTYSTNVMVDTYSRMSYYPSTTSTTKSYMTKETVLNNNSTNNAYRIIGADENKFTTNTKGLKDNLDYIWIAIG